MAQSVGMVDSASLGAKPPLEAGVRVRLSIMMFLQFAIWGVWFIAFGIYIQNPTQYGGLGFSGTQTGSLYGTMALGAIVSTLFAGQLADRLMPAQILMGICHLGGAALMFGIARTHDYNTLWWMLLGYALLYNPTLALSNAVAFTNVKDATRDFPTLRVLGTIGWIAANFFVAWGLPGPKGANGSPLMGPEGKALNAAATNLPLISAAWLSLGLGVFSFVLPHTPPTGKKGDTIPILRACKLLAEPSFGVFFGLCFVITIALGFYYAFIGPYLHALHDQNETATSAIGQISEIGFMLLLPFALRRLGMKFVLSVGMAAWALRYVVFSRVLPPPVGQTLATGPYILLLIGVALHGVCFDFLLAAGFIYTDEKAPPAIRGSAQALFSFLVYGVGMYVGNEVAGRVVDRLKVNGVPDWSRVWLVPAGIAFVCLIAFVIAWRDRPRPPEPQGFPVV
jgi:nucleoside transporter